MTEKNRCFDVTGELGERPIELVLGYVSGNMVMCGVRKATPRGVHVAAVWEVKNGLHLKETVSLLSCRAEDGHNLIDALWLLFGKDNTNLKEIRLEKKTFSSTEEFWKCVAEHGASHAVARSRLSSKMRNRLAEEAKRLK